MVLRDPRVASRALTMQGFDGHIGKYTSLAYLEAEKEAFWVGRTGMTCTHAVSISSSTACPTDHCCRMGPVSKSLPVDALPRSNTLALVPDLEHDAGGGLRAVQPLQAGRLGTIGSQSAPEKAVLHAHHVSHARGAAFLQDLSPGHDHQLTGARNGTPRARGSDCPARLGRPVSDQSSASTPWGQARGTSTRNDVQREAAM
jgi:hypothetical protein